MSRTPTKKLAGYSPRYVSEPKELNLSDDPTIKGKEAARDWYHNVMSVPVTLSWIAEHTRDRSLPSHRLGKGVYYSTRDLFRAVHQYRRDEAS